MVWSLRSLTRISLRNYVLLSCISTTVLLLLVSCTYFLQERQKKFVLADFLAIIWASTLRTVVFCNTLVVLMYFGFHQLVRLFMGTLRSLELQQAEETAMNFVVSRSFIFVQCFDSLPCKNAILLWHLVQLFLRCLCILCKTRFNYLAGTVSPQNHWHSNGVGRVVALLSVVLLANCCMVYACLHYFLVEGISVACFILFESCILFLEAMQLGLKICIHLLDYRNFIFPSSTTENNGSSSEDFLDWENRDWYSYVVELSIDVLVLLVKIAHYVHIIARTGCSLSVLNCFFMMNMKQVGTKLVKKCKRFLAYRKSLQQLDTVFADATKEELETLSDDVCAICLKPMVSCAKKLRCNHYFHRICLRQCLEREPDSSLTGTRFEVAENLFDVTATLTVSKCPICRKPLYEESDTIGNNSNSTTATATNNPTNGNAEAVAATNTGGEAVFRFSTHSLPSWLPLPNFSFEVVRRSQVAALGIPEQNLSPLSPFQAVTPQMVSHVQEIFPQIPVHVIQQDLGRTHSPEQTIENILAGNVMDADQSAENDRNTNTSVNADDNNDLNTNYFNSVRSFFSEVLNRRAEPSPITTIPTAANERSLEVPQASSNNVVRNALPPLVSDNESRDIRRRRALQAIERRQTSGI